MKFTGFEVLDASTNAVLDTETVAVNDNGTYATPIGFAPATGTVAGTYQWHASYSGDANNNGAADQGGANEALTILQATPALTTSPTPASATTGSTLADSATLTGGFQPTGTITFTLEDPSNATVDTEAATVNANGTYTTPVGVLATVRTEQAGDRAASVELPRPDATGRVQLAPLRLGALHGVVSHRLGRTVSRPAMVRIHEVSGGNPFYAIELARSLQADTVSAERDATMASAVPARLMGVPFDPGVSGAERNASLRPPRGWSQWRRCFVHALTRT